MSAIETLKQVFDIFVVVVVVCIIGYSYYLYIRLQNMRKQNDDLKDQLEVKDVTTTVKGLSDDQLNAILDKNLGKKTD